MIPHLFIKDLKKDINQKLVVLNEYKNAYAKNQEYELASLYKQIENKMNDFLEELKFEKLELPREPNEDYEE
jgi:hypothetical protein